MSVHRGHILSSRGEDWLPGWPTCGLDGSGFLAPCLHPELQLILTTGGSKALFRTSE